MPVEVEGHAERVDQDTDDGGDQAHHEVVGLGRQRAGHDHDDEQHHEEQAGLDEVAREPARRDAEHEGEEGHQPESDETILADLSEVEEQFRKHWCTPVSGA